MTDEANQLLRAQRLAEQLHVGQVDKAGVPYIEHCKRVAGKLTDECAQTVAWLHDVLEDTTMSEAGLKAQFDVTVVNAVVALTRKNGENSITYYRGIRANPLAREVKLADIHDNLDPLRMAMLNEVTKRRLLVKYGRALQNIFEEHYEV